MLSFHYFPSFCDGFFFSSLFSLSLFFRWNAIFAIVLTRSRRATKTRNSIEWQMHEYLVADCCDNIKNHFIYHYRFTYAQIIIMSHGNEFQFLFFFFFLPQSRDMKNSYLHHHHHHHLHPKQNANWRTKYIIIMMMLLMLWCWNGECFK